VVGVAGAVVGRKTDEVFPPEFEFGLLSFIDPLEVAPGSCWWRHLVEDT